MKITGNRLLVLYFAMIFILLPFGKMGATVINVTEIASTQCNTDIDSSLGFIDFLLKIFNDIENSALSNQSLISHSILYITILVISILILIFPLAFIAFTAMIFITHYIHQESEKRVVINRKNFCDRFSSYMLEGNQSSPLVINEPMTKSDLDHFIFYISIMYRYYGGKYGERLMSIFLANVSKKDLYFTVDGVSNYRKAAIFKGAASLATSHRSAEVAKDYINSSSENVRLWSLAVYLSTYPDEFIPIISQYKYYISRWEQIVICSIIRRRNETFPDLNILLESENNSVILFALRIMRSFGNIPDEEHLRMIENINEPIIKAQYEYFKNKR